MGEPEETIGPCVDGVIEQVVDDEMILFNPQTESYFTLNRTAREVWDLADGTRTASQISKLLADRYGIALGEVEADVGSIVTSFRDANLI